MIVGHGDDLWRYDCEVRANFSSNVFSRVDLSGLQRHLASRLDVISNYPEPEPYTLERAVANRLGIPAEAVCVTAGATEAIYLIALALHGSRSAIVQPTFSEYEDACRLHGHSISTTVIPTGAQRTSTTVIPTGAQRSGGISLLWLCNPNNPTGRVMPAEDVRQMISDRHKIFVIDQSYGFFTEETLMSPAEAVEAGNVLQLHSMTKRYAMPGMRLGYVVGRPSLLDKIRSVRMPWSVNALAIEAGLWLTKHPDTAPRDKAALLAEAQRLRNELNRIPGISVLPTSTHFMLCEISTDVISTGAKRSGEISRQARDDKKDARDDKGCSADTLKTWLMERHGLLIRDASNFEGLGPGHFRIAAQTPQENDLLIAAIKEYMQR